MKKIVIVTVILLLTVIISTMLRYCHTYRVFMS